MIESQTDLAESAAAMATEETTRKSPKQRISMFFKKDKARKSTFEESEHDLRGDSGIFDNGGNHNSVYDHNATQNWSKSHAPYSPFDHHLYQHHGMTTTSPDNELNHTHNDITNPSSPVSEKPIIERQASVQSSILLEDDANSRIVAQLKGELARQRYSLENLEIEKQQYSLDSRALSDRIAKTQERLQQRVEAKHRLEASYNDHIRSMRATDDDLESISSKLKQLKMMIGNLTDDLVDNVDPKCATGALRDFWLNLRHSIEQIGSVLPLNRIRMLTEKYMMDFLIPNMTPHYVPGLSVEKEYGLLEVWLRNHDRYMATRLRQEVAKSIMSHGEHLLAKPVKQTAQRLYSSLSQAYPYMQQHDTVESDATKRYEAKVQQIVEYSIMLGFAMKGQEDAIVATVVQEGAQPFNPAMMVDEEGRTAGQIEFCICPPFVVYSNTAPYTTVLEKGRVLCSPARKA